MKITVVKSMILLTILFIFSCGKNVQQQSSKYPVKIATIGGIKFTTSPDYPRDGKIHYMLQEELSIGVAEGDEKYLLNRPLDLRVTANGTIYVMDWGDVCIKVYDKWGKYRRKISRKGQGPGEFGIPAYFTLSNDDKIYLMDSRNSRISILDTNGVYLSGFRLIGGYFSKIMTDSAGYLYFSEKHADGNINIFRYDQTGKKLINFGNYPEKSMISLKTGKTSSISMSSRIIPTTVWGVDPKGRLYESFNDVYCINVHKIDGSIDYKFGRDYKPIPYKHPKRKRPITDANWKQLNKKYLAALPEFKPAFRHKMLFDEQGNLWLELFYYDDFKEHVYDVFSPEGVYIKQVFISKRIFQLKGDKIYSIFHTEEDYPVVKRYGFVEELIKD